MTSLKQLQQNREELLAISANHGAFNVWVFGSIVCGEATPENDIYFLSDSLTSLKQRNI